MINLLLISLKEFWKNLIQNKFVNYTLKQLSEIFEFEIIGDENYSISQVSSIDSASEENIVFISHVGDLIANRPNDLDYFLSRVTRKLRINNFCTSNIFSSSNYPNWRLLHKFVG